MAIERSPGGSSLIDVLDRVLDKGIVIDAWVRVSLVGIDLLTVEARVVVASIATYLQYSDLVSLRPLTPVPAASGESANGNARRRNRLGPTPRPLGPAQLAL
jgi:gas vesicle structural protein